MVVKMLNEILELNCDNPKCKYYNKPVHITLGDFIKKTNSGVKVDNVIRFMNIQGLQCIGCLWSINAIIRKPK